jgi:hypothetical protein
MTENYRAFHNLFHTSCSMRAELDRLLCMAKAYPHFQEILKDHYNPAVDSNMVHALRVAKQYEAERTFPPRHIVEQLYMAGVQMLDKLDRIEHYRLATVESASCPDTIAPQRQIGRLVEDFNVNVGEVNEPARQAIEAIRPYLRANAGRCENRDRRDRKAAVANMPGEREHAAI